jgi:hypothetical protein
MCVWSPVFVVVLHGLRNLWQKPIPHVRPHSSSRHADQQVCGLRASQLQLDAGKWCLCSPNLTFPVTVHDRLPHFINGQPRRNSRTFQWLFPFAADVAETWSNIPVEWPNSTMHGLKFVLLFGQSRNRMLRFECTQIYLQLTAEYVVIFAPTCSDYEPWPYS